MCRNIPLLTILVLFFSTLLSSPLIAADVNPPGLGAPDKKQAARGHSSKPIYSPYAGRNFPTRPYFGDTHLHTAFSMDAGAFGARLNPEDAYRFARGEEIMASSGQPGCHARWIFWS
jgi:hypothetical protein